MRNIRTTAALAALLLLFFLSFSASAQRRGRPAPGWMELPASADGGSGGIVSTQYMVRGGASVRSHTYRYDPSLRVSLWVAYPLNAGLIGEGSRGDGWHPYAGIDECLQPVLYKGFRYGSGYDRGHQIPSADRLERDSNHATFAFVNATPQRHAFNEGPWADLERLVRTWAKRSDTLYVVTGAVPGTETAADNGGNPVNVPRAYWKAVLRRNTDRYGRVRWSSCAVLIPHDAVRPEGLNWPGTLEWLSGFSLPLRELERITGEELFPRLPEAVGKEAAGKVREETWKDPWWFR